MVLPHFVRMNKSRRVEMSGSSRTHGKDEKILRHFGRRHEGRRADLWGWKRFRTRMDWWRRDKFFRVGVDVVV
jgi:hypothetical protein